MNFRLAAAVALTTVLLIASGCASTEGADNTQQPAQPAELIYRTGSNIPVREKAPLTAEEKAKRAEEAQRALQQMQATGAGKPKL